MNEKISVIIPVYRSEKYLCRCVDSVLAQSYADIEVLLIDDGSPDGCPKICDAYGAKDNRCVVIHQENGGASSARNEGLRRASGDYIVFVDSDDTLPPDAIEKLYLAITGAGAQFSAGAISNGKDKPYPRLNVKINFKEAPLCLLDYLTTPGSYSPYAKIFAVSIIRDHNIYYNEALKCSEDALFIRQYLRYCSSIRLIPDTVYYYNSENADSLSKKFYPEYSSYYIEKLKALALLTETLAITEEQRNVFLKERAVHGLKISTAHYLSCGKREVYEKCICRAAELLSPWLSLGEPVRSGDLRKWWHKHCRQIENKDIDGYIRAMLNEQKHLSTVVRWKALARKFLKI